MFSSLFGKRKPEKSHEDAVDSRGLEVVEDDPDTAWSRWNEALALQDSGALGDQNPLPDISENASGSVGFADEPTQPMGLNDLTPDQRKIRALQVVEMHHRRIANSIRTLWGYKECSVYVNRLLMEGDDRTGHARAGFNQETMEALLALTNLHDELFGHYEPRAGTGFGDLSVRPGWDGSR